MTPNDPNSILNKIFNLRYEIRTDGVNRKRQLSLHDVLILDPLSQIMQKTRKQDIYFIKKLFEPSLSLFKFIKTSDDVENLLQEIFNVFIRITHYKIDALIPLSDLIDQNYANSKGGMINFQAAIQAVLFSLENQKIKLAFKYYYKLGFFIRSSDLESILINLNNKFMTINPIELQRELLIDNEIEPIPFTAY